MSGRAREFADAELVGVINTMYTGERRASDEVRYRIAQLTVSAYADRDIPLVVMDASPNPAVARRLEGLGGIVIEAPRPGLATQTIDGVAFAVAHGATKVVRHEAEKEGMVEFADEISAGLEEQEILVIGRTEEAMASLPKVQARTERLAGWLLEQYFNFPPDALSGGRAYTPTGAEYLARYDVEEHGNNWLYMYFPVLAAMEDGVRVGGLQVPLLHPPEMVAEEEGNLVYDRKRYEQFFMQMEKLLSLKGY